MAGIKGKQIESDGSNGIATANINTGALSAAAGGRALMATDFFDSSTVTAKFASSSIALDRLAENVLQADGGQAATGDLPMGSNKITGLGDPTAAQDAATKTYVDSLVSGLQWREPAAVLELVGNATIATINGLSPTTGDAYVATDAGTPSAGSSDALTAGDITEYNGADWKLIVDAAGGFPPAGTRVVLSVQTTLISPYTDATDDGQIRDFTGASLTADDTGEATDGSAVLINADGGNFENNGYVYDGTVPSGTWVQFTGSGSLSFGAPVALGAANDAGSGTDVARANHVHKRDTYTIQDIETEALASDTALSEDLSSTPLAGSLHLDVNGQVVTEGVHFTLSGATITWLGSSGPYALALADEMTAKFVEQG